MSDLSRRFVFLACTLFMAATATANITGTWSGTYNVTTRCHNGGTHNDTGSLSLGLVQSGNDVSGIATADIVFLNDNCQPEDRVTLALPVSGGFTGNTLNLKMALPGDEDEPFIRVTATVSGTTMSLSFSQGETSGTATLTQTSMTPPSGGLTGTYSGTFTMKPSCPNGSFEETGSLSFTLTQGGPGLAGLGSGHSSRHVDINQQGHCFYHEVGGTTPLFLTAQVSGNSIFGLMVPMGEDEEHGSDEEGGDEIQFTASASGNTITGIAKTQENEFTFTLTRTSSSLAPSVVNFSAEPASVFPGQPVTLRWDTFNASSVTIDNGVGSKPTTGSVTVTPSSTTTYKLTANSAGGTVTATTTVTVNTMPPPTSSQPCNLTITLNCPSLQIGVAATCTAVTMNNGQACSGTYITAIFGNVSPSQATLTDYSNGLGLPQCFNQDTLGFEGIAAACVGDATLPGGAQFTQSVRITPTSAAPSVIQLGAVTAVYDAHLEQEKGLAVVLDELTVPGCVPSISAPAVAQSGGDYVVSWTASRDPGASFTLEESTTPDFSSNVTTLTVTGLQRTFVHDVATNTTYYYRVRPNSCPGGTPAFSGIASTVVQAPLPPQTKEADVIVPLGSRTPVSFPFFVPGLPAGNGNFTATTDQPFITVNPSSGTVSPQGRTITVTVNPTDLQPGANTGTIKVVVTPVSNVRGPQPNQTSQTTSAPITVSLVTPVKPGGKTEPPPNSLIIPVVTHVNGAAGPFLSDVRLVNATGGLTKYQLHFTPTGSNATSVGKVTEINATSDQTLALNDVVKDFFGLGATGLPTDFGFGVLEIRPLKTSSARTFASSRTYVRTERGTLGQFIAAVPYSKFATRSGGVLPGGEPGPPAVLSLQQVAQSSKFRTNLGIVEGSLSPASGRYRVYNSLGIMLSEVGWSLMPGEHRQMNNFISTVMGVSNLEDGRIEIIVDSPTGAVTAYASVLDNKTTDPLAVMPVQASQIRSRRYVIPGMAEFGGANNFHSDVRVYNGGSTSVTVTPTFYTISDPSNFRTATPFVIGAGEVKVFDNVLPTLFGSGVSGGSIVFTTSDDSSLVVTGRTYTNDPAGGTFGQFIPGLMPSEGLSAGSAPLQLLQLEQSPNYRTNVGLVELSGQPATVRMTFTRPDSKTTAVTQVELGANHYTQFNRIIENVFGPGNYYNVRMTIEVIGGAGRVAGYGSVLDNATQDPTYVPAQQ